MGYQFVEGVNYTNAPSRKSVTTAFLLWFFLNIFSAHNWYLGRHYVAGAQLALAIMAMILLPLGVGMAMLLIYGLWLFADLFWVFRAGQIYR